MRERVMQLARRAWHALTWRQLVLRARSVNRDILFDSVVMLLFGVLNNVAVSMMSFAMPGYPSFINYFPCILCVPFFYAFAIYKKEEVLSGKALTDRSQAQYWILTWTTVLSWIALSYAAAWVDGNLQQVLSNLGFVFVFIFSVPILRLKISMREAIASLIITGGVLLGTSPAIHDMVTGASSEDHEPWFNSWYFVISYVLAILFQALQSVYQERAFRAPYHLEEASCLFWYSLHSVIPLTLMVPMESLPQVNSLPEGKSFNWAWENQAGAFRCFVGQPTEEEYPLQCTRKNAWLWVLLFEIGFVGYFLYSNILFKKTSAFWTTLLQTLCSPLSAVAFNYPQIVGEDNTVPFTGITGASFVIILVGVLVRGSPEEKLPPIEPEKLPPSYESVVLESMSSLPLLLDPDQAPLLAEEREQALAETSHA
eukprot:m.353425 g.353425  ORF g.353425 m.353425 type:complete len:426 (-) comp55923_c0_seq3:1360-2637(-)